MAEWCYTCGAPDDALDKAEQRIAELEAALKRIATVDDWHDAIPDDGYVGEAKALGDVVDIAQAALRGEEEE